MNHTTKNSQYPSQTKSAWDPDVVLGLIHPMRGTYRCTGYAPSKRRRCMNLVGSFGSGRAMLGRLSRGDINEAIGSPDMEDAAYFTLCQRHSNQARGVSRQWASLLKAWASQNGSAPAASEHSSTNASSRPPVTPHWKTGPRESEDAQVKQEDDLDQYIEDLLAEQLGQTSQESNRMRAQWRLLAKILAERTRQEQMKREQEACDENARMQKERERREREARNKAERERKEREAEKERRESAARGKAAREAEAWARSWEQYTDAWDDIKNIKPKQPTADRDIPWPVKSGRFLDVSAESVIEFFKSAPPKDLVGTAQCRLKFFNAENRKWHTDKILQQFGSDIMEGECKEAMNMIAQLVVQLRHAAQRDGKS